MSDQEIAKTMHATHLTRPQCKRAFGRPKVWLALLCCLTPGVPILTMPSADASESAAESQNKVAKHSRTADSNLALEQGRTGSLEIPDLPEAIASFGAAVAGDWLYVYGGHIGRTHKHSLANLSHHFRRLDLTQPDQGWEDLGKVKGLQGLALVAHGQRVCRIGGLDALNATAEEEEILISQSDAACYDPERKQWVSLPPLPSPRSSHDAVVLDGQLYVVGGWQLRGAGQTSVWMSTMEILDLEAETPAWRSVHQPFQRRALSAAATPGLVYALGGLGQDGTSRRVEIFDVAEGRWTEGGELPALTTQLKGFGLSAFGVDGKVYASGADGVVHALEADTQTWEKGLGQLEIPRFFHRLVPHRDRLIFVAGASRRGHHSEVESLALATLRPGTVPSVAPEPAPKDSGAQQAAEVGPGGRWPGFRGRGDGQLGDFQVPMQWSDSENLGWRTPLPGYGQSAPVVWGRQVLVTSTEGKHKEELILSSLDLLSGEVRWRRRFAASQHIENSEMVSRSAPTPVVDGERIYTFWESGDLVALDHQGETLWQRSLTQDYGSFEGNHGVASSPVLADGKLIVQVTHSGPSYYLALSPEDGRTLWKLDRPSKVAWTTPSVVTSKADDGASSALILSSAAGRIEALDAGTGELRWQLDGIEKNHVPSAVLADDLLVVASSETGQSLALRWSEVAQGQRAVAEQSTLWRAEGVSSGFGSPLVHGGCVLFVNKAGVVTCLDRNDGSEHWQQRLADASWASPVAVGEHAFFFTKKGETTVLRTGTSGPEVVATNSLPTEGIVYGVAAVEGAFLVRTGSELVRIGTIPADPEPESNSGEQVAQQQATVPHSGSD